LEEVELRHLRYFVAVAERQNVLRAATQKLHVSQPAVSRQIRDLEDELGVQLFERTGKSIRLTEPGRVFLKAVREVLERVDEAVKETRSVAGETELHVGYSLSTTARILPSILRAYQRAMPKVRITLHDRSNQKSIAGLRDGELHLVFMPRLPKAGELRDVRFEELTRERICLIASPDYPLARRRVVKLADAAREPFIGLSREEYPEYHDYLGALFQSVKQKPRVVEEHDSMSGVISSVEAGAGVAIASEAFRHAFGNRVKLLRLTPEPKPIVIGIAAAKRRLSPIAEKFWRCAREIASTKK
jgi:DNA-binding transcriptional LysR family regulator